MTTRTTSQQGYSATPIPKYNTKTLVKHSWEVSELFLKFIPFAPHRAVFTVTKIMPGAVYVIKTKRYGHVSRDASGDYRKTKHKNGVVARSLVLGQWCISMTTQKR